MFSLLAASEYLLIDRSQAKLDTTGFKDLHRRMQVFMLFYIEIGSYIEEDDPRWEFVTL